MLQDYKAEFRCRHVELSQLLENGGDIDNGVVERKFRDLKGNTRILLGRH